MSVTTPGRDGTAQPGVQAGVYGMRQWERQTRLITGMILLLFVATHLINHALGIFGIAFMEAVQVYRTAVWRSLPGTVLLVGAFAVHLMLGVKRLIDRRTWRMPMQEAVQLLLGLAIPVLLIEHVLASGYLARMTNIDVTYSATLYHLWPGLALKQTLLVLVVWTHGMIGVHYAVRSQAWYSRWRDGMVVFAVIVPALALAGFVAAGREAAILADQAAARSQEVRQLYAAAKAEVQFWLYSGAAVVVVVLLIRAIYQRYARTIDVRYIGHGDIVLRQGSTILEASRANNIPHPSLCGGRGRCSTCRVLVVEGGDHLPPRSAIETGMLERISAPPHVRLACQLKPRQPLTVQILLPIEAQSSQIDWEEEALKWGVEREATILFVDMRAFTTLALKQMPYDLVLLLNRFVAEMSQAIEANDGRVGMYLSDGLMGVFGVDGGRRNGSKAALRAARDMIRAVGALNDQYAAAIPMPLRIGIGIHTGPVVLARVGDEERGFMVTALGETVSIASQLEASTKDHLSDCLVSKETFDKSGERAMGEVPIDIHVRGRDAPIRAYGLALDHELTADAAE